MATGFLTAEEVEKLRNTKWHKADMDDVEEGRVDMGAFLLRLREVKQVDIKGVRAVEMAEDLEATLDDIKNELERGQLREGKAIGTETTKAKGKPPSVDPEAFIEYYKTDPRYRLDIQFCTNQKEKATDSLTLFLYIPFALLFAFFLVEGKGLGQGYWLNANIVGYVLEEQFDVSDDLRFPKTYVDIGGDEEFWEFINGPLVNGYWPEDGQDGTNKFQISNMMIGALKIRQIRAEAVSCPDLQTHLFRNGMADMIEAYGVEYVRRRLEDFRPLCYEELAPDGANEDTGPYTVMQKVHSGDLIYGMNDTSNYFGWQTALKGYTGLPPMFVERILMNVSNIAPAHQYVADAYQYRTCAGLNGSVRAEYSGKFSNYGCAGYGLIIPASKTKEEVQAMLKILQEGIQVEYWDPFQHQLVNKSIPWIDQQTRGVIIETIVYNQNIDLLTFSQFVIEVTASGCWIPLANLVSFKLFDFGGHTAAYYVFLFLFLFYIIGFWVLLISVVHDEATEHHRGHRGACSWPNAIWEALSFWRLLDLMNLTMFAVSWTLRFLAWQRGLTDQNILQTEFYPDEYEDVAAATQTAAFVSAANAILTFFRIFYFLALQPGLNLLTKTIEQAAKDLFGIVFIFVVVFISFALMAFVVYGNAVEDFRTFPDTCAALARVLIGDFDYGELQTAQRLFTPVFFTLFNILAVFILLNMVIAILDSAFSTVQEQKYNPRRLLALMARDETGVFDRAKPAERCKLLWRNPLAVEIKWQLRRFKQWFRLWTGQYRANEAEFIDCQTRYISENPRVYWGERLKWMHESKKVLRFRDRCNMIPRELDDILREHFGSDYQLMEAHLIETPAKAMRRSKMELLQDIIAYHHVWHEEVKETTQTGQEREEADKEKKKQQEESERQLFQRRLKQERQVSIKDTMDKLREKYGRDPTPEEQLAELAAVAPEDKYDIEKLWVFQIRRLRQMLTLMSRLSKTRHKNFQSNAPKRDFTAMMTGKVRSTAGRELADGMLRTVQHEMESRFREKASAGAALDPIAGIPVDGAPFEAEHQLMVGDRVLCSRSGGHPEWAQVSAYSAATGEWEFTFQEDVGDPGEVLKLPDSKVRNPQDPMWGGHKPHRRALRVGDKLQVVRATEMLSPKPTRVWGTIQTLPVAPSGAALGCRDPAGQFTEGKVVVRVESLHVDEEYSVEDWCSRARPTLLPLPSGMDGVLKWWRDGRYDRLVNDGIIAAYSSESESEDSREDTDAHDTGYLLDARDKQLARRSSRRRSVAPRRGSAPGLSRTGSLERQTTSRSFQ
eukprot:TRINITY_DN50906_c0_g1_i1.p1 TRINITY_DN50906_c0_g1~~TRINITY_DN50906_c0_g1_i1.p1  ORF type:complete len:1288 (+),score=511.29 TRINITY_DN50906_c0_g1_i1:122-3985(+)